MENTPKPKNQLTSNPCWTIEDLLNKIPKEWRNYPIAIGDGLERAYLIKRVQLVQNHDGTGLVILDYRQKCLSTL
jgi:hypothetical protein